jgi:murein DD-endopeptidase MepM/ murein hydrolase activator NlpD
MTRLPALAIALSVCATLSQAATVRRAIVSTSVDEDSCIAPAATTRVDTSKRQVFLWFVAEHVRTSDRIRVEWLDPSGRLSDSSDYGDLPDAAALCFATQLPIAGFAPASNPGQWRARVLVNGEAAVTREFQVSGGAQTGGLRVSSVQMTPGASGFDLEIAGAGFSSLSFVHLARYTRTGGWAYMSAAQPSSASGTSLVSHHDPLPPGEYWVIVQNPDKTLSPPMPFVIASSGGYKLPTPAGQPWMVTQGPYGSFSHWGNSLHAWDIAPIGGRCIVAMRGGIVHTHDLGLHQDHSRRTFGNYITIDHGDGEYSHYAHLATGSFVVREGQRVEQGQALATVGNSGYTLGEGGGYHVHVQVTHGLSISSGSVPFRFDDLRDGVRRGVVVSSNQSSLCDCAQPAEEVASAVTMTKPSVARPAASGHELAFHAQVAVAQWWSDLVLVRKGAKILDATLAWDAADASADLHLVSPSGQHYGWYGNTTGYSGQQTRPQEFRIPHPEAGVWRISVEGTRGGGAPIEFSVETNAAKYRSTGRNGTGN